MLAARRMMNLQSTVVPLSAPSALGVALHGWAGRTSVSSGSFTPPANTLIVVGVELLTNNSSASTDVFSISDTFGVTSWTQISMTKHQFFSGGQGVWYLGAWFYGFTGSSPTAGTYTVSVTNTVTYTGTGRCWAIPGASSVAHSVEGYTANGSSPFSLTTTFAATPDPANLILTMIGYQNTLSGTTKDPAYTFLDFDPETLAGGFSMSWAYKLGSAAQSFTWSNIQGNGGAYCGALEIAA